MMGMEGLDYYQVVHSPPPITARGPTGILYKGGGGDLNQHQQSVDETKVNYVAVKDMSTCIDTPLLEDATITDSQVSHSEAVLLLFLLLLLMLLLLWLLLLLLILPKQPHLLRGSHGASDMP